MAIPIVESHRCFPQLERNQYGVSPRGDSPIAAPLEICIVASLARSVGQVFSVWLDRISQREVWTLTVRPDEDPCFNDLQRGRDDLTLCSYCDQLRSSELSPSSQRWRDVSACAARAAGRRPLSRKALEPIANSMCTGRSGYILAVRGASVGPEVHHFCRNL